MELSKNASAEPNIYYLHGDHLGTASFVTEQYGKPMQFFLNLPFGETMAEQMSGVYDNHAKELDSETGLYYYGARYFNPRLNIWYGYRLLGNYEKVTVGTGKSQKEIMTVVFRDYIKKSK